MKRKRLLFTEMLKNSNKTRKVFLLLAAVTVCFCMTNEAMAQTVDSGTTGDCTWTLTGASGNYTLTIRGAGAMGDYGYPNYAPWYDYRPSTVIIEDGVTSIGNDAFSWNVNLTSITVPNSVTSIGGWAFQTCRNLTSITLPDNLTSIGEWAFSYCYGFTSITIPASVTSIGDNAFYYCTNLAAVQVESGNTHYLSEDGVLFNSDKTKLLCFPSAKTGDYAIPATVTTIETETFMNSLLTSITVPAGVTSIGNNAFSYCSNLTAIQVEDGNAHYSSANGALFNNDKTRLLCFPSAKTGDYTIPATITTVESETFKNSSLTSITVPAGVTSIAESAFSYCMSLTAIRVEDGNTHYSVADNVLFNHDKTTLLCFPAGRTGDYAISDGVTTIGTEAFMFSKLKTVSIAPSVTRINHNAFYDCPNLTDITVFWDKPSLVTYGTLFSHVAYHAVFLHVPEGTEATYRTIQTWKNFQGIDWTLLRELTVNNGALELDFAPNNSSYSLIVPSDVESIVLTATPFENSSIVSGDGTKALNTGTNKFEITVTASYNETRSYTVSVFRLSENYVLGWDSYGSTTTSMELTLVSGKSWWNVITGYYLYYVLQTGSFSGSLPLHFDLGNGITCERTVAVQSHSFYRIRVNVSVEPDQPITVTTPYDAYGKPGTPYVDYTYRPWTITASDGSGVIQTDITVTGTVTAATVADIILEKSLTGIIPVEKASLRVYPNPVSESFRIEGITVPTQITVTDISGKTLLQQTVKGDESISVGYLPKGVYLVRVNGMTAKIIKN